MFGEFNTHYKNYRSRAINAENPTGEKGKGGMVSSPLGPSRKGSPCIRDIPSGETVIIADIKGCGKITHIWVTVDDKTSNSERFVLRDLVLRMYWNGENYPSVEVPLGDFFASGFGVETTVNSLPIVVVPARGFNCYFPMPFFEGAVITLENQHTNSIPAFFYQIDYLEMDSLSPKEMCFHARWRREKITRIGKDYIIVDDIKGQGMYVGTYIALSTLERYWWGEGEVKFFIDGDKKYPTICGTGMEDYFGGSWSFASHENGKTHENTYCTQFLGYPFYSRHDSVIRNPYHNDEVPPMRGFYRWHIPDPIYFNQDLSITIQQIGVNYGGLFERQDDLSSVAYWYQIEPHKVFPEFPDKKARWPR